MPSVRRRVQRVPGLAGLEVRHQGMAEQRQVADGIEDLVADELVLEAQRVVQHAGFAEHDRVLDGTAARETGATCR